MSFNSAQARNPADGSVQGTAGQPLEPLLTLAEARDILHVQAGDHDLDDQLAAYVSAAGVRIATDLEPYADASPPVPGTRTWQAAKDAARYFFLSMWMRDHAQVELARAHREEYEKAIAALRRAITADKPDRRESVLISRRRALDDNRKAVEQAAALGAACLVVVAGGVPEGSRDLAGARRQVEEALAALLPEARAARVKLAIEPLHPMTCADRGCVSTLAQANDMCDALGEGVGVAVDVYHVWWDPALEAEIARAGRRILGFHVNDWLRETRDLVFDRGMMGDGVIDVPKIRGWVERAGYDGYNEVEIFSSRDWWRRDPDEVVAVCIDRHDRAV